MNKNLKAPKVYREGQKRAKEGNLLLKKKQLKEIKNGKGQNKN